MNAMKRVRAYMLALLGALCFAAVVSPAQAAGSGCLPSSLKQKLNEVRAKFGPIKVVSSHRPGARIAGSGRRSYHASCRAVDFTPPKGKYKQVAAYLKASHKGGVGTYSCGMHHIHIDNGPRVRFHKCQNGNRVYASSKSYKARKYAKRGSNSRKYASRGNGSGQRYASRSSKRRQASRGSGRRYSSAQRARRAVETASLTTRSLGSVYASRY